MATTVAQQLGWDRLPEAAQQQLAYGLDQVVLSAIERRCKPLLKRKQRKEYEQQTDPTAALRVLEQHIPDFPAIAEMETARVCREMADTQAAVMKKLGLG